MNVEAIRNRARRDLAVGTEQGDPCCLLWEHSQRVARSAVRIAGLPGVRDASPDRSAILAAALYHDAGWVASLKAGEIDRYTILVRPVGDGHWEKGVTLMQRGLRKLLPARSLVQAAAAIRSLGQRDPEPVEGRVIVEADKLDEFGVLSLWTTIRRGTVDGKGVQNAIDTWRRRKEYRFWDARLRDSFRFAAVRAVAERRLKRFERLMLDLEEQHQGDDLSADAGFEDAEHILTEEGRGGVDAAGGVRSDGGEPAAQTTEP
ncbi:MAG: HD domain-containing protein [Phycisphaerae bacterium]